MTPAQKGIGAMVLACTTWGLSPLFYKLVAHVPPIQVLSHRTLWSLVFFGLVLLWQGRLGLLAGVYRSKTSLGTVMIASILIATNWYVFIWSIQIGRATESSLGYYIFPLIAVLIGRVVFSEALSRTQWLAVGLAVLAVALLTYGLGVAPWIALILGTTFGLYGMIKKRLDVGPVVSVTAEVGVLAPIALVVLWQGSLDGHSPWGGDMRSTLVLVLAGPLTAVPLILFSYATRRVAMATVGLVQYVNPTLQFACAVLIFGEPFGQWHMAAFALIWTALAIYSVSALVQDRTARRASVSSAGVAMTDTKDASDASAKP